MKYIKKFESKLKTIDFKDMTSWGSTEPVEEFLPLDPEYIKMVFGDFIDDGYAEFVFSENENEEVARVTIMDIDVDTDLSIESYINYHDKQKSFFQDIKVCIDRVKDEYKDIRVYFHNSGGFDPIGGNNHPNEYSINIIRLK